MILLLRILYIYIINAPDILFLFAYECIYIIRVATDNIIAMTNAKTCEKRKLESVSAGKTFELIHRRESENN